MASWKVPSKTRGKARSKDNSEPIGWLCTVCTLINRHELFKCEACGTRKGTSTRKPRLNQSVVQHHTVVHNFVLQQTQPKKKSGRNSADLPSTSRQSPESTSSGSGMAKSVTSEKVKMTPPLIRDPYVIRSTPRKSVISVGGVVATIYHYRRRMVDTNQK